MCFGATRTTRSPRATRKRSNAPETCRQSSIAQTRSESSARAHTSSLPKLPLRAGAEYGGTRTAAFNPAFSCPEPREHASGERPLLLWPVNAEVARRSVRAAVARPFRQSRSRAWLRLLQWQCDSGGPTWISCVRLGSGVDQSWRRVVQPARPARPGLAVVRTVAAGEP